MDGFLQTNIPKLKPNHTFAHYTGNDLDQFKEKNCRIHEMCLFH